MPSQGASLFMGVFCNFHRCILHGVDLGFACGCGCPQKLNSNKDALANLESPNVNHGD
jgi:hypothetical protein